VKFEDFETIYDEDKLKSIIGLEQFKELAELYKYLQDMYPLKLKILKNVQCHRCGFCCEKCNAMLSKQDIELLCKYLQCSFEQLYEKYMDKNARMPYLTLPCPFLDKDKDCTVYPARPKVCREFPFNEFTIIVDPCLLGKDIRDIVEEIVGPITETYKEEQEIADMSDEFFHQMINEKALPDTGKHMRINMDINLLRRMVGHLKHKKKEKRRLV